ncbi:hypothetical protein CLV58_109226 [Spirosoma oryzae]|uniref:Uncharacterized protein n=1 Tax=Spirosoma oryzae TaxID=1469603 RepID=A0A2T0SYN0_9BACT|nr:hypothetical protein [Spirosoma oryzae]PRY38499.1 hypothetical protein CLV58_109226 [Spirosoma oryzae]
MSYQDYNYLFISLLGSRYGLDLSDIGRDEYELSFTSIEAVEAELTWLEEKYDLTRIDQDHPYSLLY